MVTARSFGPRLSAVRQRAARKSRAVESGPPDTASTRAGASARSANRTFASDAETAPASAAHTLLFPLDALLHGDRGVRIFTADLSESRAGRLLLPHRGE